MDNQNQLPMLPDPMEDQPVALPTPTELSTTNQPVSLATRDSLLTTSHPSRNYLRIGLIFGGVVAVLLLTVFGSRLADLLNLRGTKAGTEITLQGTEFINNDNWYEKDSQGNIHRKENGVDNRGLFEVVDGKLVLTGLNTQP